MSLFETAIETQTDSICAMLDSLPLDDKVAMLNMVRAKLHEISPFKNEPVDFVQWVPSEAVRANDYNPNKVAPPEMRLLERSIMEDGYTQPIVGCPVEDGIEVIDGFHRNKVGKTSKKVKARIHGYLPIVSIRSDRTDSKDRMAATIRHNRARGVHGVMPMADIVAELIRNGWHDDDIAKELGMDADEVLRFKQNLGMPELFKDHTFSASWE
jgi:ParB-like chromosome segregation protein Spo0J